MKTNRLKKQQTLLPRKTIKKNLRKKYSTTKIKLRNFLTNISYNRLKVKAYDNLSLVIDIYSFKLFF